MSKRIKHVEVDQIEDVINFIAAEYHLPKNQAWLKSGLHASQLILHIEQELLKEYPWVEWCSLWEWFDWKSPYEGQTFVEHLIANDIDLPYPKVLHNLMESSIGVYQVVGISNPELITLKNLLTAEEYHVEIEPVDLQLPWTILIGRLYPLNNGNWTGIQEWISYPPYYQVMLESWLLEDHDFLKEDGLEFIRMATEPIQYASEEFLLVMEQFEEILMNDRELFEQSLLKLNATMQKYILQTLQYSLWLSALEVGTDHMFFPWEERLTELGSQGLFRWDKNIQKRLKENEATK